MHEHSYNDARSQDHSHKKILLVVAGMILFVIGVISYELLTKPRTGDVLEVCLGEAPQVDNVSYRQGGVSYLLTFKVKKGGDYCAQITPRVNERVTTLEFDEETIGPGEIVIRVREILRDGALSHPRKEFTIRRYTLAKEGDWRKIVLVRGNDLEIPVVRY